MVIRATADLYFWRCHREKRNWGGAARRPYGVGPSSLGMLDEFSDRVLTIKQFRSSSL
jgi:hypothetical protein